MAAIIVQEASSLGRLRLFLFSFTANMPVIFLFPLTGTFGRKDVLKVELLLKNFLIIIRYFNQMLIFETKYTV